MRILADGSTPVSRLVLGDELETDDGYAFEPLRPLFLAAGDRIRFDGDTLVVVTAGGLRVEPVGTWSTRCRRMGSARTSRA
ncbi:hypothetical protein ACH4M4_32265 [Streptomyces sp. NPDC017254]|uniref:hypothetical protein n=1 Tax=unclassified Streptomyces TaxID=2593676 RepID=UPI00379E75AF